MLNDNQTQSVAEGSTAIQAAGNVTVVGLTHTEARALFFDLLKGYFADLTGEAVKTAHARVAEITDKFLAKLEAQNPAGIQQAQDPGFQHALLTVQREHSKCGDEELGNLLVDLLVDRTKHPTRDILQIVLTECLRVAPILTSGQLSTLAVLFVLDHTVVNGLQTHEGLALHFKHKAAPFLSTLSTNLPTFQHLEFSGCGSISVLETNLAEHIRQAYAGLFMMGLDQQRITELAIPVGAVQLLRPCVTDPTKLQLAPMRKDLLQEQMEALGLSPEVQSKLSAEFDANLMDAPQVKGWILKAAPFMAELFDKWETTQLRKFNLTSVGIALGHANVRRVVGDYAELSIWIN